MRTIWKHSVPVDSPLVGVKGDFSLALPAGAVVLCVQTQGGEPYVWAECDPEQPKVERKFRLVGTGHPMPEPVSALRYIGTFQLHEGHFVGHLYEQLEG